MPRPQKKRYVCCMPKNNCFSPEEGGDDVVVMTIDEHEAIRLIDLQEYTQEECAEQMQVSRTTVQGVYGSARKKIADAIVNGKRLVISGGDYHLCEGRTHVCEKGCKKQCCKRHMTSEKTKEIQTNE